MAAEIAPRRDGTFLPGRGAGMLNEGVRVGCFGELHPAVIRAFGLEQPVVAMEMRVG
jgi:phenylalanyl-tRNA synthetase beta chain